MKNKSEENNLWLQRLKDESWEAELLISTVAIFGTLQLFKLINWGVNITINVLPPSQYLVGYGILLGGLLAISILTTMFVIHFLLRAYWVGLVGLNSVFPDYGLEDSAYSEIYTKKMLSILPKLNKTIKDVDELCSVIFSAAFLMLWMYSYLSLVTTIGLYIYNSFSPCFSDNVVLVFKVALLILFALMTIFSLVANLKFFKKNDKVQSWYFEFIKWSSFIMFGPLYKYILQITMTFGSNFKKKKSLVYITFIFVCIGFFISQNQFKKSKMLYLVNQEVYFDETKIYNNYYSSRASEPDFLLAPQIDTDIVETKIVQLFVPIYKYELKHLDNACGTYQKNKTSPLRKIKKQKEVGI